MMNRTGIESFNWIPDLYANLLHHTSLINWFLGCDQPTHKFSLQFVCNFSCNPANKLMDQPTTTGKNRTTIMRRCISIGVSVIRRSGSSGTIATTKSDRICRGRSYYSSSNRSNCSSSNISNYNSSNSSNYISNGNRITVITVTLRKIHIKKIISLKMGRLIMLIIYCRMRMMAVNVIESS